MNKLEFMIVEERDILITMYIRSLYTNTPQEKALLVIKETLDNKTGKNTQSFFDNQKEVNYTQHNTLQETIPSHYTPQI